MYKNGKSKLEKRRYWEKILEQYVKESIKVKNSLIEWERYFKKLIDRELTARELKIKREIKYLNPIIVSIVDMDKLEQKKKRK